MRLSYSQLETYKNCPLRYKFHYIDRVTPQILPSPGRSFGISLHRVLKEFYDLLGKEEPSLELLMQILSEEWDDRGYSSAEEEQRYFRLGSEVLEKFFSANKGSFGIPVSTERPFSFALEDHILTGRIDRVDKLPDGSLEVIDYKTSKRVATQEQVNRNPQLSIYYWGVESLFGAPPAKLTFYFLQPNFKVSTAPSAEQLKAVKSDILHTVSDIEEKKFEPHFGPLCDFCEYQYICYGHKDKFRKKGEVDPATGINIDQIVAEFALLKDEESNLKDKIEGLKSVIHQYCEAHKVSKVYSDKITVSRNKMTRWQYDKKKVKGSLDPLGLFERVVEVQNSRIKDVLEDPQIDTKIKEELEAAKDVKSESYTLSVKKAKK